MIPTRRRRLRASRPRPRLETLESRRLLATLFVDSTADNTAGICAADNAAGNSNCTLRLAIQEAEANPGPDTIQIADGTYLLDSILGSLDLSNSQDTSLIGTSNDPLAVIIDGDNQSRVFDIFGSGSGLYDVTFQGLTIRNGIGRDGSGGGGINAASDVNLSLDNVIIQNNIAAEDSFEPGSFSSGGGIQTSGNLTISNSAIQNNTATIDGGGIDFSPFTGTKNLIINNSSVSGNVTGDQAIDLGYGGGILVNSSDAIAQLDTVSITGNSAGDSGGGIYVRNGSITTDNVDFDGNVALGSDSGGGGMYVLSGSFSVTAGSFDLGSAVSGAGGFEAFNSGGIVDGTTFESNQVTGPGTSFDQGGGAIAIVGINAVTAPAVTIRNITATNNTAALAGAIAAVEANLTIEDSSITGNSAVLAAGGIGVASAGGRAINILRSTIDGNTATGDAAGIGSLDTDLFLQDTTVNGNQATNGRAGGVGVDGQTRTPLLTVQRTTVSNNTASMEGGGIGIVNGGIDLINVTVSDNQSTTGNGGGIFYDNPDDTVTRSIAYSTIASNSAGALGNNIAAQNSPINIEGSIFADGDGAALPGTFNSLGGNLDNGTSMGFNDPTDLVSTDPMLGALADNGGLVFTRAILAGSPAIDAATNNFPAVDARGIARPLDGDGDSDSIADIGAFEAPAIVQPVLTIGNVSLEESTGDAVVQVTLDVDAGVSFTVDFSTSDGTATAPGDYETTTGMLTFAGTAGEQQAIVVPIVSDRVAEVDEQFQVTLSNPSISIDVSDIGLVSIFDDDSVILTVDRLAEAAEDSGSVAFGITVSGDTDAPFTIDVATLDLPGEAVAGIDYTATSDTLTFAGTNGEIQSLVVPITSDTTVELDEEIGVEATNISAGNRDIVFNNFADRVGLSLLGQFAPGGISANDIAIFTPDPVTTIAYVADDSGLLVLDVSDPAGVVQLGAFALASPALDIESVDVDFFDDVVYIAAGDGGLEVLDVSDPANITRLGSFSIAGQQALSLARDGGTIYLGETDAGLEGTLRILDVSDPSNIIQQGSFQGSLAAVEDIHLDGTTLYVAGDHGLEVIDVINPSIPVSLGTFSARQAASIGINGTTAYLGTPTGLAELDVSDPANISEVGYFATASEVTAIDVDGSTVTMTEQSGVIHVLNAFSGFSEIGSFAFTPSALGFDIEGLTTYVATAGGGVQIIAGELVAASDLLIVNDDIASLQVTDTIVNELDGSAMVMVSVDHAVDGGFTVDVMTQDGSAISPGDYAATSTTLTFSGAAGQSLAVSIPIVEDSDLEGDESFSVSLSNVVPQGNALAASIDASSIGTVTIQDPPSAQVNLATSITDDTDPAELGETVTFTIPVSNLGQDIASDVVSTTTLPPEFNIDTATSDFFNATVDITGNVVIVSMPALDSGITATLTIVATASGSGNVTTSTSVGSAESDLDSSDNTAAETTVINSPVNVDLTISGDTFDDQVAPGGTFFDFFGIDNNGTIDATNVVTQITLPAGLTLSSGSVFGGTVVANGNQVTATIPTLAASESAFIDLELMVDASVPRGTSLTMTAVVTADQNDIDPDDNDAESTNTVIFLHRLSTGTGDGDVTIDVDAFGTFGNGAFSGARADFDPIGPIQSAEVIFESALAVRESNSGARAFLNETAAGQAGTTPITGDVTTATSTFSIGSFDVQPVQTVAPNFDLSGARNGATLEQSYTFTNMSPQSVDLDLVRYVHADLLFDGNLIDGGGRLTDANGNLVLFETDAGGNGANDETFVGITDGGGVAPIDDRFMIDDFFTLQQLVRSGGPLANSVVGDDDGNGFIDAGNEYDVSLALRRILGVDPGASAQYSNSILFGAGPTSIVPQPATTIAGHVSCDINGNSLEDSGEAVVGTTVFLDADGNRILNAGERSTLTDSAGDYNFDNVTDSTLTVVAQVPFNCDTIPFNPGVARSDIGVGALARSLTSADADGDGDRDIYVASEISNSVTLLINDEGEFSSAGPITLGHRPQSIFAWESPQLSSPMIAVAGVGTSADGGAIYMLNGSTLISQVSAGNGPVEVVLDDFDKNGEVDILSAAVRSSNLSLLMNGSTEASEIATARLVRTVDAGDVNGDGFSDIVLGGYGYPDDDSSELVVRLGNGNGEFGDPIQTAPIAKLVSVKVASLSDDPTGPGAQILALSEAGRMHIYELEAGALVEINSIEIGAGASSFDVGDFNRDGFADLAIGNLGSQLIDLMVGNGDGQFALVTSITNVPAPSDVLVDDFDNDGADDIAVANLYQDANLGQPGPPEFRFPSTTTILRLDVAESAFVVLGGTVTEVDFDFQSADPGIRLDVSGEGEVSAVDALRVINAIQRTSADSEARSVVRQSTDVNGDGQTSAVDALMIINYMAAETPVEVPVAGVDQLTGDDDDEEDRFAAVDLVFNQMLT